VAGAALAATLWCAAAWAQGVPIQHHEQLAQPEAHPWFAAITYNMSLPLMDTRDFTSTFSPRGFGLELRTKLLPYLSVGTAVSWQVFDDSTSEVVTQGNVAVQGKQLRFVNAVPILANVHGYLPGLPLGIEPFAGLGLGASYIERRLQLSFLAVNDRTWHFVLTPEVGLAVPLQDFFFVFITRYHIAFSSAGSGDQSWLNFNLGVGWRG
jgi:hypothetical protein